MGKVHLLGVVFIQIVMLLFYVQASPASGETAPTAAAVAVPESNSVLEEPAASLDVETGVEELAPIAVRSQDEIAEDITASLVSGFNDRYGRDLDSPDIAFINKTRGEYDGGTIYVPYASQYAIAHETCHYFQDKTCSFEVYGESFCEVFAGADRGKDECAEKGWPSYYCTPFRLSEVDRQGFVDCVFEDACKAGGASKEELMDCYKENKIV